jgi:hypothetical protein
MDAGFSSLVLDEPPQPPQPPSEVLVLGAGFSAAIAIELPVTAELGEETTRRAGIEASRLPIGGFRDGNFETWLSLLAEDQPYLSDADNQGNSWTFARVVDALAEVLRSREQAAFSRDAPGWLYELLNVAQQRRPTIITLNYDTLLEVAVASHLLWSTDLRRPVTPDDVLGDLPTRGSSTSPNRVVARLAERADEPYLPLAQTFHLLKLHGSLDWYWSPGDSTGATLRRTTILSRFGAPRDDPELRDREAPGLEPFIVPPAATKSAYFRNPVTRWLWRRAFKALRNADRIVLIGYSFPPADPVMSNMIGEAIRDHKVSLEVVNLSPKDPVSHLEGLGARHVEVTSGTKCVEEFVRAYRDRAAVELVDELRESTTDAHDTPIYVAWAEWMGSLPRPYERQVAAIVPADSAEDLALTLVGDTELPNPSAGVQLPDLIANLEGVQRLVLRAADGGVTPLIARSSPRVGGSGPAAIEWTRLVPAGNPSR